ncbi:MAG: hypothetical protein CUN55_07970 [Phototrophicales bacterium]|nr:MAG: hypothetical protein CUN55_07970 [Phototrophicales bacterium]
MVKVSPMLIGDSGLEDRIVMVGGVTPEIAGEVAAPSVALTSRVGVAVGLTSSRVKLQASDAINKAKTTRLRINTICCLCDKCLWVKMLRLLANAA